MGSSLGEPRQWPTGKDEGKILTEVEARGGGEGGSVVEDEGGEFVGGFASLDSMLQWAIGNSDPEKLREKAADVQKLSADELLKWRMEIKELMEMLKIPSDAELMKIAIADLKNTSISLEDRQHALQELLVLVEPIDNANVIQELNTDERIKDNVFMDVIQELNTDERISDLDKLARMMVILSSWTCSSLLLGGFGSSAMTKFSDPFRPI